MPGHDPVLLKTADQLRLCIAHAFRRLSVQTEVVDQVYEDQCVSPGHQYWYLQIHVKIDGKLVCWVGLSAPGAAVFGSSWQAHAPETNLKKILQNIKCIINQGDKLPLSLIIQND